MLALKEAVTTESSTAEGSQIYGTNSYLEETKTLRSKAQNITLEDARKQAEQSAKPYNTSSFAARMDLIKKVSFTSKCKQEHDYYYQVLNYIKSLITDFHLNKHLPLFTMWSLHSNNDRVARVMAVSSLLSGMHAGTPRSLCLISTMPFSIHEPAKRSRISFLEDACHQLLP